MAAPKVLIVEDSPVDLNRLQGIVGGAGCVVLTARNGREALEKAAGEHPDIIFMDVVMEDMDGYEATRRLSRDKATRHIPVVFVSSKHQKADRVWARMQGGRDLVSKPYTPEQIIGHLETLKRHV
jgi:twitching motility two-component system response regulator PilH